MTITLKGWCPTLNDPMAAGDGLLTRIKPRAGHLSAEQAQLVADLAERHGNGQIELTNRGNLQLRGIAAATIDELAAAVVAAGLAAADPAVERRRNICAAPYADPALITAVEHHLATADGLDGLPGKFSITLDGGRLPLGPTGADLTITGSDDHYHLTAADLAVSGDLATVITAAAQALRAGRRTHGRASLPPGEALVGRLLADACGLGLACGASDAGQFRRLAELAATYGDGLLRLTPRRAVVLGGLRAPDALLRAARGFITDLGDPRLAVLACPGAPACSSATVPARLDALALAPFVPDGLVVHVAGCAKGCAHPGIADVTLTGDNGHYSLIRAGRAGDPPAMTGLTLTEQTWGQIARLIGHEEP